MIHFNTWMSKVLPIHIYSLWFKDHKSELSNLKAYFYSECIRTTTQEAYILEFVHHYLTTFNVWVKHDVCLTNYRNWNSEWCMKARVLRVCSSQCPVFEFCHVLAIFVLSQFIQHFVLVLNESLPVVEDEISRSDI